MLCLCWSCLSVISLSINSGSRSCEHHWPIDCYQGYPMRKYRGGCWKIECFKPWGTSLFDLVQCLLSRVNCFPWYQSCFIANWVISDEIGLWTYVILLFYSWLVTVYHHMRALCCLQILKTNFLLQHQRLIELIREGKTDEAMAFAKDNLKPFVEENVGLQLLNHIVCSASISCLWFILLELHPYMFSHHMLNIFLGFQSLKMTLSVFKASISCSLSPKIPLFF